MKRQLRTVIRTGDTGRLKRDEVRAVIIAIRDGLPMPKVTPISDAAPQSGRTRPRRR